MKLNRSYSLLEIRTVDDEKRIIEGIATTPSVARDGDIIETEGIIFKLPIPFLLRHKQEFPLGNVISASAGTDGIRVRIQVASAGVAEHIDEAWRMIKAGVIRGLSLGWRTLEEKFDKVINGFRIIKSEWLELSAVPVPADMNATITSVRSIDTEFLAASGNTETRSSVVRLNLPGVSGLTTKTKGKTMTIKEQIAALEAKRQASDARMKTMEEKSAEEGRTFDDAEKEEYDTLQREVEEVDEHLVRLRKREKNLLATATPVTHENTSDEKKAAATRGGTAVVQVKANVPKGTTFSRWVLAQIHAKGDMDRAADFSRKAWPDMPEVEMILRAQVLPGTTTATTWAAPLIPAAQNMQSEFLDLLRPATLIGRIPGLRRVPANISVPAQTGGATFQWVGEGIAKPVSALAFSAVTLRWAKAAGIVVITKELARYSSPDAEATVRDSMVKDCGKFLDEQFITPTVAEVTNVSPAAITNGATTAAASGVTAAAFELDMSTAIATFITANDDVTQLVILMSGGVALNVMKLRDALGNKIYPELTLTGGTIMGLPVIVSNSVGARIVVLNANDILYNDDGPIEIDASEQASIIMDDTPAASPQTTSLVSLWQHNYLGIRVEKWTTWKRARSTSVYYISNAVYSG